MASHRQSDRWITPGVIVAAILVAGLVVLGVTAGLVYLTAEGKDPDPVLRLVAQVVTAIGSLGSLVVTLATRTTTTKTERNTGVLARATAELVDAVQERPAGPDPFRDPLPTVERRTAPAPPGRTPA